MELLNNLLYYVGRAESSGARVTAVRASFRLTELLPVDESIEQERENLSAPSVKLMQTVAAAIREDLAKVKDVLDIFVRRGAGQPQELGSQVELLRKIGDTLGVLGLGELRAKVQVETERLTKIVEGSLKADESTLVDIAATLIGVEDQLDDGLVGMILPRDTEAQPAGEDTEFQQVQAAVLRECIVNLARIKEAVTQSVGGTLDAAGIDSWQDLMRGMKAGLLLLGKARAVEVIEGITDAAEARDAAGHARAAAGLHRPPGRCHRQRRVLHGDAAGRAQPIPGTCSTTRRPACRRSSSRRRPRCPRCRRWSPGPTPRRSPSPRVHARAGAAGRGQRGCGGPDARRVPASKAPALAEHADPELVKLFIEEAHEELAKIQHGFPVWDENPLERDALVTVRRSLPHAQGQRPHGRRPRPGRVRLVDREPAEPRARQHAHPLAGDPGDAARGGRRAARAGRSSWRRARRCRPTSLGISSRAHALAAGTPGARGAHTPMRKPASRRRLQRTRRRAGHRAPAPRPQVLVSRPASAARPIPDDTLRDIYARETATHVATVRAYLAREAKLPEPHALPEEVYRACHTLSGSSKMAQARHGIRLAEPLDHWLRRAFGSGLGLCGRGPRRLLADCMTAMESVATHLDESTGYFVNHWQLLERIERADKSLDARIAARRRRRAGGRRAGAPAAPERRGQPPRRSTLIRRSPRSSPTRPPSSSRPPSARWRTGAPACEPGPAPGTQAPAAHAQGRRAHGGHHGDGGL